MFLILNKTIGLRVTPEEEEKGLNIVEFEDYYSWEKYIEISGFEAEIKEKNNLLRKQARLLVVTEEQERKKLARDLHDGVGQSLAALKLMLGLTKKQIKEEENEHLSLIMGKALKLAETSIEEMREVLNNLGPKILEEKGLTEAVRALVEKVNELDGITCRLKIENELPSLDNTIALNIYRVLQEALTNVIKHSKARNVSMTISFHAEKNLYVFKVTDDGIGFQVNENELGLGILSMGDRVKMLGGNFQVSSRIKGGTTVMMEVPVHDGK